MLVPPLQGGFEFAGCHLSCASAFGFLGEVIGCHRSLPAEGQGVREDQPPPEFRRLLLARAPFGEDLLDLALDLFDPLGFVRGSSRAATLDASMIAPRAANSALKGFSFSSLMTHPGASNGTIIVKSSK